MIKYTGPEGNTTIYDYELEARFDQLLDDNEEWPTILGMTFQPSRVLKEYDPGAYRESFINWADAAGYTEANDD